MAHWTGSFESTPMQDVLSEIMTSARDADSPRSARGGLPTTGPGSLGSLGDLGAAGGAASAGAPFCADVSPPTRGGGAFVDPLTGAMPKEGEASAYEKLLLSPMVSPGRLGSCKESPFEEEARPDPVSCEDSLSAALRTRRREERLLTAASTASRTRSFSRPTTRAASRRTRRSRRKRRTRTQTRCTKGLRPLTRCASLSCSVWPGRRSRRRR